MKNLARLHCQHNDAAFCRDHAMTEHARNWHDARVTDYWWRIVAWWVVRGCGVVGVAAVGVWLGVR